jgi:hypothetical protein
MAVPVWQSRWRTQPKWLRAISCAVLAALATVLTAPLWHSHAHPCGDACRAPGCLCHGQGEQGKEHGNGGGDPAKSHDDDEDSCAICMTVSAPMGDGLPTLPVLDLPGPGSPELWLGAERWAVMWVGRDRASRGPPVGAV